MLYLTFYLLRPCNMLIDLSGLICQQSINLILFITVMITYYEIFINCYTLINKSY